MEEGGRKVSSSAGRGGVNPSQSLNHTHAGTNRLTHARAHTHTRTPAQAHLEGRSDGGDASSHALRQRRRVPKHKEGEVHLQYNQGAVQYRSITCLTGRRVKWRGGSRKAVP